MTPIEELINKFRIQLQKNGDTIDWKGTECIGLDLSDPRDPVFKTDYGKRILNIVYPNSVIYEPYVTLIDGSEILLKDLPEEFLKQIMHSLATLQW